MAFWLSRPLSIHGFAFADVNHSTCRSIFLQLKLSIYEVLFFQFYFLLDIVSSFQCRVKDLECNTVARVTKF